jgi:hypothetical protein
MSSYITENNHRRCVKLRGLPFQASQHDIVAFFQDSAMHGCFGYLSISDVVID